MINPEFEINKFKNDISRGNLSVGEVESIISMLRQEIDEAINMIINDAMNYASEMGNQVGAGELVQQLFVVANGGSYQITTEGSTSFHEPPFPMLPKLLKNAKVAKDGSMYKHIPMEKKDSAVTSSADAQTARSDIQKQSVKDRNASNTAKRQYGFSGKKPVNSYTYNEHESKKSGDVNFKTASSKQDPATQWVHPGRDVDISFILNEVNHNLDKDIEAAVLDIISRYRG